MCTALNPILSFSLSLAAACEAEKPDPLPHRTITLHSIPFWRASRCAGFAERLQVQDMAWPFPHLPGGVCSGQQLLFLCWGHLRHPAHAYASQAPSAHRENMSHRTAGRHRIQEPSPSPTHTGISAPSKRANTRSTKGAGRGWEGEGGEAAAAGGSAAGGVPPNAPNGGKGGHSGHAGAAAEGAPAHPLIFSYANCAFYDMALNFLAASQAAGLHGGVYVIATDPHMLSALQQVQPKAALPDLPSFYADPVAEGIDREMSWNSDTYNKDLTRRVRAGSQWRHTMCVLSSAPQLGGALPLPHIMAWNSPSPSPSPSNQPCSLSIIVCTTRSPQPFYFKALLSAHICFIFCECQVFIFLHFHAAGERAAAHAPGAPTPGAYYLTHPWMLLLGCTP